MAAEHQRRNLQTGFVPTMGFLHEGHLSLIKLLNGRCDVKMASIFVNPLQFGPNEDYDQYPRDEERDLELLENEGCDLAFMPSADVMYPANYQTYVEVDKMSKPLCGAYRPGFFRGVATVVLRLFNVTRCDVAAFGLKDYQQATVIKKMIKDLLLPVELILGGTVREPDGLALSSRNKYLSEEQRRQAAAIPKALEWARRQAADGVQSVAELRTGLVDIIQDRSGLEIQYIEFFDPETLESRQAVGNKIQVALAVFAGKTRLIDNLAIGVDADNVSITVI